MRKALISFGKILKYTFLFLFGAFVLVLIAVTFFDQPVPRPILTKLTDSLSGGEWLVSVDSASFRLAYGLKLRGLKVFARRKPASKPILSAKMVDLKLDLTTLPWTAQTLVKHVTITELDYPRLGDGYYIPDSVEFPGQPDFREKDEPLVLSLPNVEPFGVTLIQPNILAVTPKFVEISHVAVTERAFTASGIHLQWNDDDAIMPLDGECTLDLDSQLVKGDIDSFTQVTAPVKASCAFDVNLRNNDLHILLDLHPTGGRHNNVPLKNADGQVDIRVFVRDTFQNARIVVGPIVANIADGHAMSGTIIYENTNDVGYVLFKDIKSSTSLSNALAVADVMNDGTLDCLSIATPPRISLNGRLAVNPAHAATNSLDGTLAFEKGSFFSIPLTNASTAFHVRGTEVSFTDASATAPHGGTVTGEGRISIPDFKQEKASFSVSVKSYGVSLTDFAEIFKFDVGDKHSSNQGSFIGCRICGSGHIECRDGHLAQMKVFAGLTDYLAKHVSGIASFVNQSRGTMDFSITNGIFRAENIRIDGGFFSIQASGTYDIPKDNLDFTARVTFTKNDGFFSKLATPITWPFANLTKMLLDFKIFGSLEQPEWKYNKSLMDRLK